MKILFVFGVLGLSGCGAVQRTWTGLTNELTRKCESGVTYLQSDSGIALLVDREGKPVPCDK